MFCRVNGPLATFGVDYLLSTPPASLDPPPYDVDFQLSYDYRPWYPAPQLLLTHDDPAPYGLEIWSDPGLELPAVWPNRRSQLLYRTPGDQPSVIESYETTAAAVFVGGSSRSASDNDVIRCERREPLSPRSIVWEKNIAARSAVRPCAITAAAVFNSGYVEPGALPRWYLSSRDPDDGTFNWYVDNVLDGEASSIAATSSHLCVAGYAFDNDLGTIWRVESRDPHTGSLRWVKSLAVSSYAQACSISGDFVFIAGKIYGDDSVYHGRIECRNLSDGPMHWEYDNPAEHNYTGMSAKTADGFVSGSPCFCPSFPSRVVVRRSLS